MYKHFSSITNLVKNIYNILYFLNICGVLSHTFKYFEYILFFKDTDYRLLYFVYIHQNLCFTIQYIIN